MPEQPNQFKPDDALPALYAMRQVSDYLLQKLKAAGADIVDDMGRVSAALQKKLAKSGSPKASLVGDAMPPPTKREGARSPAPLPPASDGSPLPTRAIEIDRGVPPDYCQCDYWMIQFSCMTANGPVDSYNCYKDPYPITQAPNGCTFVRQLPPNPCGPPPPPPPPDCIPGGDGNCWVVGIDRCGQVISYVSVQTMYQGKEANRNVWGQPCFEPIVYYPTFQEAQAGVTAIARGGMPPEPSAPCGPGCVGDGGPPPPPPPPPDCPPPQFACPPPVINIPPCPGLPPFTIVVDGTEVNVSQTQTQKQEQVQFQDQFQTQLQTQQQRQIQQQAQWQAQQQTQSQWQEQHQRQRQIVRLRKPRIGIDDDSQSAVQEQPVHWDQFAAFWLGGVDTNYRDRGLRFLGMDYLIGSDDILEMNRRVFAKSRERWEDVQAETEAEQEPLL